ncbi:MAG: GNAT family N-acetyltransferase [Vicinamibacterales bacterium]|nr:GNAT family N-acetyltransferase [Vicinamibacterales bacterium]
MDDRRSTIDDGRSTMISIRVMRPEDARAVAALSTQLGYPADQAQITARHTLINDRKDARLFVAERSDAGVVGWIHVQAAYLLASDPRAEIWGLVVDEAARGTGIGRCLVEAAEAWARTLDMNVIVVRSNQLRVETLAFYEHLGYRVIKTQNAFRKSLD